MVVVMLAACRGERSAGRQLDGEAPRTGAPRTSTNAPADGASPTTNGPSTTHGFDAREVLARARVSGIAYAAVSRERELVVGGAGLADRARDLEATADTVFEAASIAKLVVATCVMQMVEEKALDLDAPIAKVLGFTVRHPRFEAIPITLRMLLTHRASLRDRLDELMAPASGNALEPFLRRYLLEGTTPRPAAFLDARPGATVQYSNVGAALAALVVERVAGEDFAKVSARRVLEPLRMRSTRWVAPVAPVAPMAPVSPEPAPTAAAYAIPYAHRDGDFVALPSPSHAVYPAVDLHSTARDLARFARAILRDGELEGARILSPASVRLMLSAGSSSSTDGDSGAGDQALAWQLRVIDGAHVAGHEGEDAGATTALFLDVGAGTGAVILANGDAFASGEATRASAIQSMLGGLLALAH